MSRIAVVGSREYDNLDLVRRTVQSFEPGTVVISGGARGVDSEAERAAVEAGLETVVHRPDWDTHGKRAAFLRNQQIVEDCDEVYAFWDGKSRGTRMTIDIAYKAGKFVVVVGPNADESGDE